MNVLGVWVDPLTVDELHERIRTMVAGAAAGRRGTILHANVHAVNLACDDPSFARLLREADVVFCDGHGVMLGARLLRQQLPQKITYAEWTWQLADLCAREGFSLYLLGSRPGVADLAAARLRRRRAELRIAGTHHGYFDKTPGSAEGQAVLDHLNTSRPDIVLVGFGMPLQERWVAAHRSRIDAPVVLTAGAAFDYVSGQLRRPPRWMTRAGLEWLGRLAIEPRRLAARYLLGNPAFIVRILRARLR